MSSSSATMPVSEGLILSVGAMLMGCIAGVLTCVLKSRCTKISFCGISCERDVIPPTDLENVQVSMDATRH